MKWLLAGFHLKVDAFEMIFIIGSENDILLIFNQRYQNVKFDKNGFWIQYSTFAAVVTLKVEFILKLKDRVKRFIIYLETYYYYYY